VVDHKILLHKQKILCGQSEDIAAHAKRSFEKIQYYYARSFALISISQSEDIAVHANRFFGADQKILLHTSSKILRGQSEDIDACSCQKAL
jgi:ATP-dependent protease ClpP protease subunit